MIVLPTNISLNLVIDGTLNDLWRYRINDSTWTWMGGSSIINQQGVYGDIGIASSENVPGSRWGAVGWYDSLREEFWLFGGVAGSFPQSSACVYQPEY